jgi:hypothetical protein
MYSGINNHIPFIAQSYSITTDSVLSLQSRSGIASSSEISPTFTIDVLLGDTHVLDTVGMGVCRAFSSEEVWSTCLITRNA